MPKNVIYRWVDEETEAEHRLKLEDGALTVETKLRGRWSRSYREIGPSARLLVALVRGDEQLRLHGRVSAGAIWP